MQTIKTSVILRPRGMALGRGNVARSRNSWGPMSVPSGFHRLEPDEEFAEEYTERMMSAQMRQLDPLKEDLAEWLNKNLGESITKLYSYLYVYFNKQLVAVIKWVKV